MKRYLYPAIMLALAACTQPQPACTPAEGAPMAVYTLYFGRAVAGRADVTDAEWRDFQSATIAVALPDGFTVFDATGAWRNPKTQRTVQENTKVLVVALPDTAASSEAVTRVRDAYRREFRQQSVGQTITKGCGVF